MPQANKMPAERKEKQDANDTNANEKMPFPKTSAQMVGWKSASAAKDAYGIPDTRASGKCDVLRVLQWPHEGLWVRKSNQKTAKVARIRVMLESNS